MTTADIILHLFCLVNDSLPDMPGHSQAKLYPIELIFPIRQGRSPQQVGKKGRDKGRWSVGIKFCWLLNDFCRVVAWD